MTTLIQTQRDPKLAQFLSERPKPRRRGTNQHRTPIEGHHCHECLEQLERCSALPDEGKCPECEEVYALGLDTKEAEAIAIVCHL